jgi:hypothetical protein
MKPIIIGIIVFACTFGGTLLGMWLRTLLPGHHLSTESKDTVKVGIGLIATMTALVLGLVTASAKGTYDALDKEVKQSAADILTLDRILARYGPDASEIRKNLKKTIGDRIEMIWARGSFNSANLDPISSGAESEIERLGDAIRALNPHDDDQRALKSRALDLGESLMRARWLALVGVEASVPGPFLAILLFWLTITFASFGLFAPSNATVLAVLFVCALSVANAVFLVLEMDMPFNGLLRVSSHPLRYAYEHLNQ